MRDHHQLNGSRWDPRTLFYLISALGILLYFLLSLRWGGQLYTWMIQENAPEIRFIDYFPHLDDSADRLNLYQHMTGDGQTTYMPLFPPLAYGMYHLLYRLTAIQGEWTGALPEAEQIPGALSVFSIYLIFNALLLFVAIEMTGQRNRKRDWMIFTLLMLSAIFAGSGFLTGNSTMLVLGLLMIGLQLRDSASALRREAGLWLLATCVALKLYPAVFGLLYLKEKRYKELLRLILYSLLLLFVPFVFFGGVSGVQAWVDNLLNTMQTSDYGRPQYLQGIFATLIRWITGGEAGLWGKLLTIAVCLGWVWLAWRSESKQRTMFFLICLMVFFPSNSFRYTLSYFAIPLVMLLKAGPEEGARPLPTGLLSTLYGLLYTIPVWWLAVIPLERRYEVYALTSVEIYLYLVAYVLILVMTAVELRALRRGKEKAEAKLKDA